MPSLLPERKRMSSCLNIYFGEITFFDSAGFGKFEPNEWDKKIGDMLKLPMKEEK